MSLVGCRGEGGSRYVEGGFQYWFSKMYHNDSRSQRYQNSIIQDVLRFPKSIFRDILRFQDSSNILKKYKYSEDCSNIFQNYREFLRFQAHPNRCKLSKISLRFQDVEFPFCFRTLVKAHCFRSTDFLFMFVDPTLSKLIKHWPSGLVAPRPFQKFQNVECPWSWEIQHNFV